MPLTEYNIIKRQLSKSRLSAFVGADTDLQKISERVIKIQSNSQERMDRHKISLFFSEFCTKYSYGIRSVKDDEKQLLRDKQKVSDLSCCAYATYLEPSWYIYFPRFYLHLFLLWWLHHTRNLNIIKHYWTFKVNILKAVFKSWVL